MVLPYQKYNISKFNQNTKSHKTPRLIYTDLESLIKQKRWMQKQSRKILINKNR